ncbi:MAG: adenylyl-sulfate kinase [Acutalibacteraceae bacterium]|nr:adenylyl-sulfate kinase [Acutalibacteraceae bacterium]
MQIKLSEINDSIKNNATAFIDECDAAYCGRIREIAEDIHNNVETRPIVLISGPSGSGKTTTAMTLEKMLDEWGIETHTLSMDNYFCTLTEEEVRLAEEEKFDLESPDRVDAELLSSQLADIAACKTVNLPKFDFKNHSRVFREKLLHEKRAK